MPTMKLEWTRWFVKYEHGSIWNFVARRNLATQKVEFLFFGDWMEVSPSMCHLFVKNH